jgi:hypothetical protein
LGSFEELFMVTFLRQFLLACACLFGWTQAHAILTCSRTMPVPILYVGDVAHDSKCTDDNIQHAIDNLPCQGAKIVLTGEHTYTAQHLTIQDKSLSLIGTTAAGCGSGGALRPDDADRQSLPTAPVITVSGTTSASVIAISGSSNVTLQYLEITGGNQGSGSEGGGIFFGGSGSLTLNTTTVDNNHADFGAGIDMSPTGNATLTLQDNSLVIANTAMTSGGGIRIEGATHLIAVSDQTLLGFNVANSGDGGGLEVIGPARADIGSPGYGAAGVISNNTAAYGGGIAAVANQNGGKDAIVQLFTTFAERPVNVQNNIATAEGGAIYLKPNADFNFDNSFAIACAINFRIEGNTAPEGAAIYLDFDTAFSDPDFGGTALLNRNGPSGQNCGPEAPADFGAVACAANAPCNELSGNVAQDAQGNPNGGAIIFASHDSVLVAGNVSLRNNQAAHTIHAVGTSDGRAGTYLSNSLVAGNQIASQPLLGAEAYFFVDNCTFADDGNNLDHVIKIDSDSSLEMHDTIIDEAGTLALDYSGDPANLTVNYVLSNDISTLPASATVISGDPLFVDPAHGNYHLQAYRRNGLLTASRAIDFAPTVSGDSVDDLGGDPYGQDVQAIPDFHGTRDLGAYEMQPITDRIFADALGDATSLVH